MHWAENQGSFEIQYRRTGESNWDSSTITDTNAVQVTNLTPNTEYEWQIRKICDRQNISAWMPGTRFITLALPCNAPIGLFENNITTNTATLGWNERNGSFSVQYKNIDSLNWTTTLAENTNVVFLAGLEENTTYEWKVQSICNSSQYSEWANGNNFTTIESGQECISPVVSPVSEITDSSATITWDLQEGSFEINYKIADSILWTAKNLENESSMRINNLRSATDYVIRIRKICDIVDTSEWSAEATFCTLEKSGIDALSVNFHVNVFPNPVMDKLFINISDISGNISLSLININGKQVYAQKLFCSNFQNSKFRKL